MTGYFISIHLCARALLIGLLSLPMLMATEEPHQVDVDDELQARWQHYWQDRYGGIADDHGDMDAAVVAERIVEDLERMVEMELASYGTARVAARLHEYPEHLALDVEVREWIRVLGNVFLDPRYSEYLQAPRTRKHQFLGVWNQLSEWWFKTVGPSLPSDDFRDLLLESARVESEFPLSPLLARVTFVLRELVDDSDRDRLYELLLHDGLRSNYLRGWSRVLHSSALKPRREELVQLLARDDLSYVYWAVRMLQRYYPEDERGQEAALNLMRSNDYDIKMNVRQPLRRYFRSDIPDDRKQELFNQYLLELESYTQDARGDVEVFQTIHLLGMHFVGFPEDILKHKEGNIDRVISLFEWANDEVKQRSHFQGDVSGKAIVKDLKKFEEIKKSMVESESSER